jgi:hypothetical protein
MREIAKKVAVGIPAGFVALMGFLATVSPEDAQATLAKWARFVGVLLPSWLTPIKAVLVALVIALSFYAWYFRRHIPFEIRLKRSRSQATVASGQTVPSSPPPLSRQEENLIQDLRTLWELHGTYAAHALSGMYGTVLEQLRQKIQKVYWWRLLLPSKEALQESIGEVAAALAHDSTMGLAEVRSRFNRMLDAYIEAIRWIYLTAQHGDTDAREEQLARLLGSWSESHRSFRQELNRLETIPGHHGTLTRSLDFAEDRYVVNLARPILPDQSTPDTATLPVAAPESDARGLPEPYISFEPGVVQYQKLLDDAPSIDLEVTTWFIVFQRSRIANQANGDRYVTMSFEIRSSLSEELVRVPSSNVWFKRGKQFYHTDLRLAKGDQTTVSIAAALTVHDQAALFGSILGARRPPDVSKIDLDVVCTARDMANRCEQVFRWTV